MIAFVIQHVLVIYYIHINLVNCSSHIMILFVIQHVLIIDYAICLLYEILFVTVTVSYVLIIDYATHWQYLLYDILLTASRYKLLAHKFILILYIVQCFVKL